jgi:hypothetical protein
MKVGMNEESSPAVAGRKGIGTSQVRLLIGFSCFPAFLMDTSSCLLFQVAEHEFAKRAAVAESSGQVRMVRVEHA